MRRELTYEDVSLFSREVSGITSRFSSEISLHRPVRIGDRDVQAGLLMSAPMFDVTGERMCEFFHERGEVPVLHRFMESEEQFGIVERMAHRYPDKLLCFSVGINDCAEKMAAFTDMLAHNNFRDLNFLICIDTANGSSELLQKPIAIINAIKAWVYEQYHINIEILAGNIVTWDAADYLYEQGVRFVRVGISGGSVCSTSEVTGIFRPLVSALDEIAQYKRNRGLTDFYIVADGGIKTSADALKALALGADFVMLGGLLAGYYESNSPLLNPDGEEVSDEDARQIPQGSEQIYRKLYRGMASAAMAQLNNHVNKLQKCILPEGVSRTLDYRGALQPFYTTFTNSFRSSFSYCNARSLTQYQHNVEVVEISQNSAYLRKPHFNG